MKLVRRYPRLTLAIAAVALAALAFSGGYQVAASHYQGLFSSFMPVREKSSSYDLIAPLLTYRAPEATELGEYTALKSAMQADINTAESSGAVARVSVYFRDLDTSSWVGINQADNYYPASLLKVPVLIAYYRQAEETPSILDQSVVYQDLIPPDPFEATSTLVVGHSYTINQLIAQMVVNSDNGATFELISRIDPAVLDEVYADLGITEPGNDSSTYQISTRTYALFFRVLYNATYLDPEYSEKALELLSQDSFTDGLVAGTPAGQQIAHKWGEHVLSNDGQNPSGFELHDCGIVYAPDHPYLLCVMTSASNLASAENVIKTIAATASSAVAAEYATSTASY